MCDSWNESIKVVFILAEVEFFQRTPWGGTMLWKNGTSMSPNYSNMSLQKGNVMSNKDLDLY